MSRYLIPILFIAWFLFLSINGLPADLPSLDFHQLMLKAEENPRVEWQARQLALKLGLPWSIYLPEQQILIEAKGVENGQPVYTVIRDFRHPFRNGSVMFYEQIEKNFSLSKARIVYYHHRIIDNTGNLYPKVTGKALPQQPLLLIPESSNDQVMAFDVQTGDLLAMDFIPNSGQLSTPIQAQQSPWGTITISDQILDVVQEFDTSGVFLRTLAPAGGANSAIMDNVRGHAYHPGNEHLLSTSASGSNAHAVVEFDSTGNHLGNFIANGSGGLNSPWGIWFREADVLVSGSGSPAGVFRYALDGTFLNVFASVSSFPEQVVELADSTVAVANFSGNSGVLIFSPDGTLLRTLTGVTGNRGVWQLGNGNILTTNSGGVHELDAHSGNLIRTIVSGVSARFISLYQPQFEQAGFLLSRDTLDFGQVNLGDSRMDSVLVSNTGSGNLNISSVNSSHPDFQVQPTSATIAPGDSLYFQITFTPSSVGTISGEITFVHNAPGSPSMLMVTGSGLGAVFALSPTTLNLGSIYVGQMVTDSVLVSNQGNIDLSIDSVTVDNPLFSIQPMSAQIAPAGQEFFYVTAAADSQVGSHSGQVIFYHNGLTSPDTLMVQVDVLTGITEHPAPLPERFVLYQNYPNPFNPATTIKFDLPVAGHIRLEIFNILGQQVATALNAWMPAGTHEVTLDASQWKSGVYFYRLETENFTATRKMLLMK